MGTPLCRRCGEHRLVFVHRAAGDLALIVVAEIAYGIVIGWLSCAPAPLGSRSPRVRITLSLLTPYAAFLVPLSRWIVSSVDGGGRSVRWRWNGPLLIPAATRLPDIFF